MKELRTELIINAPVEKVWKVLTDFPQYPNWNPFIKYIQGNVQEGEKIQVKLVLPGSQGMVFTPKVLLYRKNNTFAWQGHLLIPGLFDGEHRFELHKINSDTTKLVQAERFGGILVPFFTKMIDVKTKEGFEAMNAKLKERCEP